MKIDAFCHFPVRLPFSFNRKSKSLFSCKNEKPVMKLLRNRLYLGIKTKRRPCGEKEPTPLDTNAAIGVPANGLCFARWRGRQHKLIAKQNRVPLVKAIFACCLLLIAHCIHAQVINLSFDKQRILLGEQIAVGVKVFVDKGKRLDNFPLDTLPHFEILESSKIDTAVVGGALQLSQTLTITSWDSGRWSLPTTILGGTESKPIFIDVAYTSPWNPQQPYHDIKGIVPVKNPGKSTWWWYLVGLAVLVALFLLFFPESKKGPAETQLDKSAYKKAMEQLEALQKERSADARQRYTSLVTIFRTYLKGAKGIQSFTKTTDDLSIQLQSQKMPASEYNALVQTLRLSDLVKFAAYNPDERLNNDSLNTIKQSITTLEYGNAV